jgi:hypothetical protein
MPIHSALMRPGRLVVDVMFPMRPARPASAEESIAVLVAAHADAIMAALKAVERLEAAGFRVEDVTDEIAPGYRPEAVHYAASAECENILSALAALDAEGLSPNHVQYITDDNHYEVDVDQLERAEPSL